MFDPDDYIIVIENAKSRRKHYKTSCDKCEKDRGYQPIKRAKTPLCRSCSSSATHTGKTVDGSTRLKMSSNNWISCGRGPHPMSGKSHSQDTIAKISRAASLQCRKSGSVEYHGLKGNMLMKSGWEVRYAQFLDKNNIDWEYEPCIFTLSSGQAYIPDFRLGTGDIIEIKGWWRQDAKTKWELFCEEYPNINKSLLMKHDLKKMGII